MADALVEERLSATVISLRDLLTTLPKFRPTVPELAAEFDMKMQELLDTLIQVSQAAAIDERALIFAKDRSDARNARLLSEQKMRGEYDVTMANLAGQAIVPCLEAASVPR